MKELKGKDVFQYVLGALLIICFFAFIVTLIFVPIPEPNQDLLTLTAGALIGSVVTVVGFYFGSSKGSADKNDMLITELRK